MTRFSTRAIQAATRVPHVDQIASAVPIYQAAAFSAADAAELGDVLTGAVHGYAYSRIDNPTTAALAAAVAELEGAESGLAFATGMAAIHAAIVSVVRAGQTIVVTNAVYGTTRDLLVRVLGGLGIAAEFVDPTDPAAVEAAIARTKAPALYVETVSNPTIVVSDIAALAAAAHRHGALVLVDNTFASPYACRPLELGADLAMHSATKYLSGHSDVLAGVAVGSRERIDAMRPILVDVGGALAPLAAFLVLRGLPTLAIRMERHTETAIDLAAWLQGQEGVARVLYPGLPGDPSHAVARRQLSVYGGMLAFELSGGRRAGQAFLDAMRLAERTASLGSVRTIISHPPSTTHRQLDEAALAAAGIAAGLLRCSVGLEDVEDLREDLELGLAAAVEAGQAK
jgi:methionine-gamma-lyase